MTDGYDHNAAARVQSAKVCIMMSFSLIQRRLWVVLFVVILCNGIFSKGYMLIINRVAWKMMCLVASVCVRVCPFTVGILLFEPFDL